MNEQLSQMMYRYSSELKKAAITLGVIVALSICYASYHLLEASQIKSESVKYTGLMQTLADGDLKTIETSDEFASWSTGFEIFTKLAKARAYISDNMPKEAISMLKQAKNLTSEDMIKEVVILDLIAAELSAAKTEEEIRLAKDNAISYIGELKNAPVALEVKGDILADDKKYKEAVEIYTEAKGLLDPTKTSSDILKVKINYYSKFL